VLISISLSLKTGVLTFNQAVKVPVAPYENLRASAKWLYQQTSRRKAGLRGGPRTRELGNSAGHFEKLDLQAYLQYSL
jgi:hypothetical protein